MPLFARIAASLLLVACSTIAKAATEPVLRVVEYYNTGLRHYFLATSPVEMDLIDHGSAGPGWVRTGWTFGAYAVDASHGAKVSRFYGTPGLGSNSHFYTADASEAAGLMRPGSGWTFEQVEFQVDVPDGRDGAGACAPGLVPVYRLYNGRWRENDGNHRYVTDAGERVRMGSLGWIDEGVRFCAREASLAPVKSYAIATPLAGNILASARCEDESQRLGACIAVNQLPVPGARYGLGWLPWFSTLTGVESAEVFVEEPVPAEPWSSNFVQADGPDRFGIHVDSARRTVGDYSSINPLYQFRSTVTPGAFDERFFPWTGYESGTELRVGYDLAVKTIATRSPGSAAYGHPTLEFIDIRSGHHLYFTVMAFQSMDFEPTDYIAPDVTGKAIVGTTYRPGTPFGRSLGAATLRTPAGFTPAEPAGSGGSFDFRMNRAEFQRVLDAGRTVDAALSASPDDYILDNFHFNNEVYKDGAIGMSLSGFKLEVLRR